MLMQNFTLFSAVDQIIVDSMANQAPGVDKRVRAINRELDALQAEYDLFDAVREKTITVKTDGSTAYDLSTLVTDNDVKSIKDFNLGVDENGNSDGFTYLDLPAFTRKVEGGSYGNYYTLYIKDGIQYLNVLTLDPSSVAISIKMLYTTTFKALDTDNDFIPAVVADGGVKILLHENFKELIAFGAIIRLFYPAIGEDSQATLNKFESKYADLKVLLGLSAAKTPQKVERKLHLRKQW